MLLNRSFLGQPGLTSTGSIFDLVRRARSAETVLVASGVA